MFVGHRVGCAVALEFSPQEIAVGPNIAPLSPLLRALQSRVWMPSANPFVNYRWVDLNCCRSDNWTPDWSRSPRTRASIRHALSLIPPELRAQYEASTEARAGQYTKHIADLVYYPRRVWEPLSLKLIPAFFTARVHSEVRGRAGIQTN